MSGTPTHLTPRQRHKLQRTVFHCFAEAASHSSRARSLAQKLFPIGSRVVWHDEEIEKQREGTVVAIDLAHFSIDLLVQPDDESLLVHVCWTLVDPATGGGQ